MRPSRTIRVLLVAAPGPIRERLEAMLTDLGHFTVVRTIERPDDIASVLSATRPDAVVLEGRLVPREAAAFAQRVATDGIVCTLLVDDDDASDSRADSSPVPVFRIHARALMAQSSERTLRSLRTTLNLFAARSRMHRVSRASSDATAYLEAPAESRPAALAAVRIEALELMTIGARAWQREALARILLELGTPPVPIVVCVEGVDAHQDIIDRCAVDGIELALLDGATQLSALPPRCIAHCGRRLLASARSLLVGVELGRGLVVAEALQSLSVIAREVLALAVEPPHEDVLRALRLHATRGGAAFTVTINEDELVEPGEVATISAAQLRGLLNARHASR